MISVLEQKKYNNDMNMDKKAAQFLPVIEDVILLEK